MVFKIEKIKKFFNAENTTVAFGIAMIVIGLIILIFPKTSLTTICLVLGIFIGIKGALKLFEYIKAKQVEAERLIDLISAIFTLIGALILILHPEKLLSIIPVFIGIGILIYGISSLIGRGSIISKIFAITSIIVGCGIIGAPFKLATAVTSITGVALIIVGILAISKYKSVKDIRKVLQPKDDGYKEVEFTDVDD